MAPDAVKVSIGKLKPHPENYKTHPESQIRHLAESIRRNGVYKNVVTARDYTLLAGHGILAAAKIAGVKELPVVRMNLLPSDPAALKIVAADNELGRGGVDDADGLARILRIVAEQDDVGLLGTGHDELPVLEEEPPVTHGGDEVDGASKVQHTCPKCGFAWAAK
jgi:ParB-like chromosome segregation protein Spo0J